jgi:hypothetical protein
MSNSCEVNDENGFEGYRYFTDPGRRRLVPARDQHPARQFHDRADPVGGVWRAGGDRWGSVDCGWKSEAARLIGKCWPAGLWEPGCSLPVSRCFPNSDHTEVSFWPENQMIDGVVDTQFHSGAIEGMLDDFETTLLKEIEHTLAIKAVMGVVV